MDDLHSQSVCGGSQGSSALRHKVGTAGGGGGQKDVGGGGAEEPEGLGGGES